ncbi:MAG: RNA methyltransferase [Phormidesmis priestleyi]|uniref:RNA methyltransferase n=1 Tax=Phormidesmis priestleyi TaxID=268141 RepID=A0A2W4WYK5_9CYAN|nr:MAG: RNA methyltransferase [Phormidesmis priestleyi]
MALAAVRIVLVAPAGPLNVGSVARVMKNFGLSQLWLVAPQCDPLGTEAMQMAVHAKDVLQAARLVETIPDALVGCARAIATTARQRGFDAPLDLPEIALPNLLLPEYDACTDLQSDPQTNMPNMQVKAWAQTALIFGPEDRGLSNEELTYAQNFTKIPTNPNYSALNLAQAVAICCYELYRASQLVPTSEQIPPKALRSDPRSGKKSEPSINSDPPNADTLTDELPNSQSSSQRNNQLNAAKLDDLEGYFQHLERVLLQVEYLYPHTAASRMRKFRQLLHRAAPTASEVALLRGILRQMEWALSDSNKDPL